MTTAIGAITIKNPFLCPNCGKENARWNSKRELVICPDCSQEVDLDKHALNAAIAAERLEYLRGELRAERISYGELAELESLAKHIDAGDVELLEAAGVKEGGNRP